MSIHVHICKHTGTHTEFVSTVFYTEVLDFLFSADSNSKAVRANSTTETPKVTAFVDFKATPRPLL